VADVSHESAPDKRAPEPLDLVQRFVNSVDLEDGDEELASPAALRAWLRERGLIAARDRVDERDLSRALAVREGLRALLLANNGEPLDAERVATLEAAAAPAGIRVSFAEAGAPALSPHASGVDGALARLLAIVAEASARGDWERLKACPRHDCQWAFFDHSRNHSGRWCRMESCGNVEKARAYRARRSSRGVPS
jgi:predicted RNA-binding Zn ribbon-like protein